MGGAPGLCARDCGRPKDKYGAEQLRDVQFEGIGGVVFARTSAYDSGPSYQVLPFSALRRALSREEAYDCFPLECRQTSELPPPSSV